jgi:Glyoxalase-like domain
VSCAVDHLVVVADSLTQGAAWCRSALGVEPVPGGSHHLMGTHNCLLAMAGDSFAKAYLEVIAVDPDAPLPQRARWFAIDDAALRKAVRVRPRLVNLVARTRTLEMLRWGLINCGLNPGVPIAAQRDSPAGPLRWRILVRDDGVVECGGALPTLIEWQGPHPSERLPASPLRLQSLRIDGLPARAADVLRLRGVELGAAAATPRIVATIQSPAGLVTLRSR